MRQYLILKLEIKDIDNLAEFGQPNFTCLHEKAHQKWNFNVLQ